VCDAAQSPTSRMAPDECAAPWPATHLATTKEDGRDYEGSSWNVVAATMLPNSLIGLSIGRATHLPDTCPGALKCAG